MNDKMNDKTNTAFILETNKDNQLVSIKHRQDPYNMNWLNQQNPWGRLIVPQSLNAKIDRSYTEKGNLREAYTFSNDTGFDVFAQKNEAGIYTPLADSYPSSAVCMKERCNAHTWCGENTAYLYGLRMGGEAPHLGMVLTGGSLDGYSIERDFSHQSNDRGSIILHPEAFCLLPGEQYTITWELFWFNDVDHFFKIISEYENIILVSASRYVCFLGEEIEFETQYKNKSTKEKTVPQRIGEEIRDIEIDGFKTVARTVTLPPIEDLARARCAYIVEKQQYHNKNSRLDGAFLVYDTEDECIYYSHLNDQNGGRERVAMGTLLAVWLRHEKEAGMEAGLALYTEYVCRELFDEETGTVFNDITRNNHLHRLYNYPWMAIFFMERFNLYGDTIDLRRMYKILMAYYAIGGSGFYAIGIPMCESIELLRKSNMKTEAEELLSRYREHADMVEKNGLLYPAHEVRYEQSIAAPAVDYLLQTFILTHDEKYRAAAESQMRVLELFNGRQPDHHLYETAIRHWDGYWFGKRRMYGDTFPHYWSALTGNAFALYAQINNDPLYMAKAEHSLRGVLSLFRPDGAASCACVYPQTINGVRTGFYDPWANDQDWGLYYYLKRHPLS
jgi:hypothetical protein